LEFLDKATRFEEEIKGIWTGKEEVKLPLCADDMIPYPKGSKKIATKRLLDVINTFRKVAV
jgi:hypothetical protein